MRLLFIFAATIALSLAESEQKHYEDLEAAESTELQKTHDLKESATAYNSVPYPSWKPPQQYPKPTWTQTPQYPYAPPVPQPPQYVPGFPSNPPPVQNDYVPPPQYPPQNPPNYHYPTTTTPTSVIKNEQYYGDNGSSKYEYQITDGTWVGEETYFTNSNQDDASLVKKGWYSYVGADGKTYTVTWWADHTGFHAFGEHLPKPPPIPPAIQAGIDQNAKEEAAKAEAEKNKPYTTTQKTVYYDPPQQPQYIPQQPQYIPQQPQYIPQQPQYPPQPQQPYYPPQPQQPYYPPQPQQPY